MLLPELLAPAGNLEKLKVAILYGADAVYLGGQQFGMRAGAANFTPAELELAIKFTHDRGKKLYVTLNTFAHDEEFDELAEYASLLEKLGIDAVIVSDLGVLQFLREKIDLPFFLSTQASCLNSHAARLWKNLGIKRIILGREVSINEAGQIRRKAGLEVELFVHGAMCMSYSGNCVLSTYLAGRDSNRGACVQACRFGYKKHDADTNLHPLSSKDLYGLPLVEDFIKEQIDSLKIEGRMKSLLYVATVTRSYRRALDAIDTGCWNIELLHELALELESMPHRDYSEASLQKPADFDSIYQSNLAPARNATHDMLGIVLEGGGRSAYVKLFKALKKNEEIELLAHKGSDQHFKIEELYDPLGRSIDAARQESLVAIPTPEPAEAFSILRVKREISK